MLLRRWREVHLFEALDEIDACSNKIMCLRILEGSESMLRGAGCKT